MASQKTLMDGLGLFAVVETADGAGYLSHNDATAAQRARIDFGGYCDGLAADYLSRFTQPTAAKQALRGDFAAIGSATSSGQFTSDEAGLVERFITEIDKALDRLATKPRWRITLGKVWFQTPTIFKVAAFLVIVIPAILLLTKVFRR